MDIKFQKANDSLAVEKRQIVITTTEEKQEILSLEMLDRKIVFFQERLDELQSKRQSIVDTLHL